jgi:putative ABC transport system ATP-binding protein
MLKADKLNKYFVRKHGNVTAVENISLVINEGDFVSITGPSGSGKSTLLLMLGGMSTPTSGDVTWEGESIFGWTTATRAKWRASNIGFVFQSFNLIPYLSVYQNVKSGLSFIPSNGTNDERIDSFLSKLELDGRKDHLPSELSVGQQQRVALARALIKNPSVILADEPTGNLDPETGKKIIDILVEVNKVGKTIVLITHDPALASIAKKSYRIVDGKFA